MAAARKKKAPRKKAASTAPRKKSSAKKAARSKGAQRAREVDAWFAKKAHPLEGIMQAARDVFLAADPRLSECVKWSTPTFVYQGNLASFQPNAKKAVSLMFHHGAAIPGRHPGLLGDSKQVRTMRFESVAEVKKRRAEVKAVVKAWCDLKDS